ncbi:hypothetical protein PINS_up013764 [Pythium insidiosum]|nr:hypothetical protein PINS_up013764 [Pythium insidiosum]
MAHEAEIRLLKEKLSLPDGGEESSVIPSTLERIRELEEEVVRLRVSSPAWSSVTGGDVASLSDDEYPRSRSSAFSDASSIAANSHDFDQMQKILKDVIADNGELMKTIRELQAEKNARELEYMKDIERVREENSSLRQRLDDMRVLAVNGVTPDAKEAKQKHELEATIKRLRADRHHIRSQLHQCQHKLRNLERELTRSQSVQATARSITTDFLCEM